MLLILQIAWLIEQTLLGLVGLLGDCYVEQVVDREEVRAHQEFGEDR